MNIIINNINIKYLNVENKNIIRIIIGFTIKYDCKITII